MQSWITDELKKEMIAVGVEPIAMDENLEREEDESTLYDDYIALMQAMHDEGEPSSLIEGGEKEDVEELVEDSGLQALIAWLNEAEALIEDART